MAKNKEVKFHSIRVPDKRFSKGYKETAVYTDGTTLRFGNNMKGYPIASHPQWNAFSKSEKRAIRRAAFRAGFRNLATLSLPNRGKTQG